MNAHFVNIKVDREERPDVDRVYMTFVQATTGGGGWPMSVWLTPALKPFVGGTYFPPEDRHGQPGFPQGPAQRSRRRGKTITARSARAGARSWPRSSARRRRRLGGRRRRSIRKLIDTAYQQIARGYDSREGGFGGAPKFPRPVTLNFLFHVYQRAARRSREAGEAALGMALFTLRKMAAGGMHDQLGGGFHRYSVDALWHVPHFEKMLYDQAQLASAYLDAFQITRRPALRGDRARHARLCAARPDRCEGRILFRRGCRQPDERGRKRTSGRRVLRLDEGRDRRGARASTPRFSITTTASRRTGNAPEGSDPQGEFDGKNILYERQTFAETAKHFKRSEADVDESMRYRRGDAARAAREAAAAASRRQDHHRLERAHDFRLRPRRAGSGRSQLSRGRDARGGVCPRQSLRRENENTLRRSYRGGRGGGGRICGGLRLLHPGAARSLRGLVRRAMARSWPSNCRRRRTGFSGTRRTAVIFPAPARTRASCSG